MRTEQLVGLAIIAILGIEIYALANKRPRDTISEVFWRTIAEQPWIAFILGMLAGHLTWLPADCWKLFR